MNEEGGESDAERESRRNVSQSSPTPYQIEQMTALEEVLIDGNLTIHLMSQGKLVENYDDSAVMAMTMGHPSLQLPPFDDLRPQDRVEFSELSSSTPNQVLWGKYLLCQTISTASVEVAVVTVITDPKGDLAMPLALYNYSFLEHSAAEVNADDILPPGSFLALKNPCFKETPSGLLVLFSENPAEVELVSKKRMEAKFPDVEWKGEIAEATLKFSKKKRFWSDFSEDEAVFEKLRELGDKGFGDSRFSDAIRFYDMALDYCEHEEATIQSKKSAALLALGCFSAALKCSEFALEVDPSNEKYNYRKTKALIGLKKYEEALSFLERKFNQFPSLSKNKDCKNLMGVVKVLCSRQKLGPTESQLLSIRMDETFEIENDVNISEFTGPLKISEIWGKGRGLVATEDISTGQLLLCAKAFGYQATPLTNHQLKRKIANMLTFDPELGPQFYSLTTGGEADQGHLDPGDWRTRHVDMKRILDTLYANMFCTGGHKSAIGLWLAPSFFNHSCSEHNCVWDISGEFMTVRAIGEIKKGEELTVAYQSPTFSYEERRISFKYQGFSCSCKLCQLEAQEPVSISNERQEILKSLELLSSVSSSNEIAKGLKAVEKLASLRKDSVAALNFSLLSPEVSNLIRILMDTGRHGDALPILTRMFEVAAASVCWHSEGINVAMDLISCHAAMGDMTLAKFWVATVKRMMMKFDGHYEITRFVGGYAVDLLKEKFDIDFFNDD